MAGPVWSSRAGMATGSAQRAMRQRWLAELDWERAGWSGLLALTTMADAVAGLRG